MARPYLFPLRSALYAAVALLCFAGITLPARAQIEPGISSGLPHSESAPVGTVLLDFSGGSPISGSLLVDESGSLYGSAGFGGYAENGTVFRLKKDSTGKWHENILYQFKGFGSGLNPLGDLIRDAAGNLYGTTVSGGNQNQRYCNDGISQGCGLVFELSPTTGGGWKETVLYEFTGGVHGMSPQAGLVQDAAGNLYGTTQSGGAGAAGVVFELTPAAGGVWTDTVLHAFVGVDGQYPVANLAIDATGNLYGTTPQGGNYDCGVVFELSPGSGGIWNETVIKNFKCDADGGVPLAGVTVDSAGNLYGTTYYGGIVGGCPSAGGQGCGVAFKLSPSSSGWRETVLYTFTGADDGGGPEASLVLDASGNLYGTTVAGGLSTCSVNYSGCGVVFELSPEAGGGWKERVLHAFRNHRDGASPVTGLVLDGTGNLYGTTLQGGYTTTCNCGAAFEITP